MNEELKPGALSSGLVQGKSERDDHPSFAIAGDLNNFLVRRQLLIMESKRIQSILLEANAEVKAKQDHLADIRDRAMPSLRDQIARRESADNRPKLKDLPRTAERYVRKRLKRLLASPKRSSAGITDSSHAIGAQDPSWHLPMVGELDGWNAWFAESEPDALKTLRGRKDRVQAALVVNGGIGDLLKSTHLVTAISNRFSCDLTIIAAQRAVKDVVAHNPYVASTIVPANQDVFGLVERLCRAPIFDIVILWRYGVQYIIPPFSRLAHTDVRSMEGKAPELRRVLEKYFLFYGRPTFFFSLSREMTRLGLSAIQMSVATSGLHFRDPEELPFFLSKRALRVIAPLLKKPYITVHHGFDSTFLPARTRTTDYSSTKNISMEQWRQIASLIREQGVEIIQLGSVEEERIEGVTHCLNGQTSFEEAGLLIKHSLCHIDTEGGLVHLAHAVHGRCVVLFGPTPVEFFGYPQNINLEPSGCRACWFATQNWLIECPRHTDGPECMRGHSATRVADAAKRIIAEKEKASAKLILAEIQPSLTTPMAMTVARGQALLERGAARRLLLIFDNLHRDVCTELLDRALGGGEAILCSDESPDPVADRVGDRVEYGSLLNLPRASSSIDGIVWVSGEVEADIAPLALDEIFRILKPGGQLVFVAAEESVRLDLRRSLSAAQIAFYEDEMPSAPVCGCSLRKSAPSGSGHATSPKSLEPAPRPRHADDPRLALIEEENKRQISVVRDRFAEKEKVMDEARAVVDDAVKRGFGADGWISVSNLFADGYPTKFFVRGWSSALDWVIWSRENKCLLILPVDEAPPQGGLELQLHLTLPQTNASNPASIGVQINDGPIKNFHLLRDDEILTVTSTDASSFLGISLVKFHLGVANGGAESEQTRGALWMGVRRFRYRLLSG
jgi:ADP-heptose:LPS heptosyltransferase